ncbi:MAG TPA: GNAT family N-acetyltransferase [Humisphaera sp.]|jgi:ribosomal protein S18 acetylase RimI-like enzyme|nr:GNAT family N-acetyltransferase [Humisphaera sp.]
MSEPGDIPVTIRPFRASDRDACRRLYSDGLLGGKLAENDTRIDLDDIEAVYLKHDGNHFWVAEAADGQIVGMVGVQHYDDGVGEIRRLRVSSELRRRGIGSALMETALKFCQDQQYLKITLDTFMDRDPAIKLFEKFHFKHHRTREVSGKSLMYFFLDLYENERGGKTE